MTSCFCSHYDLSIDSCNETLSLFVLSIYLILLAILFALDFNYWSLGYESVLHR